MVDCELPMAEGEYSISYVEKERMKYERTG